MDAQGVKIGQNHLKNANSSLRETAVYYIYIFIFEHLFNSVPMLILILLRLIVKGVWLTYVIKITTAN